METVEELTGLAMSLYQEERGLKVVGKVATNDLLLLYRRVDGGEWEGKEVVSWGED
jgi:hypothetical protein